MYADWIELFNDGASTLDLSGYSLSDNSLKLQKWTFQPGFTLNPGDRILVWCDGLDEVGAGVHSNFRLDVGGETIYLSDVSGIVIDSIAFVRQFENRSYGIDGSGSWFYMINPTPGMQNILGGSYQIAHGIIFDPIPGAYATPQLVELTCDIPGSQIYYTTDGAEAGTSTIQYTGPINVTSTTVIRAKVIASGYTEGWSETGTYLINESSTLPKVSISTSPENLWDDYIGIYVTGLNGITGYCSDIPRNYNQPWEILSSFEYLDPSGERQFQLDGGVQIFGGCSRGYPMKSLAFYSRNIYGKDQIRYPFFPEKPEVDYFKDIVFRNSGNDFNQTMFRDAVIQSVVKGKMNIDLQAFQPSILFLNGQYWGIHNIREKINEHWVESNYGHPAEEVDFLENRYYEMGGSSLDYRQMITYIANNSPADPDHYQYIKTQMDIDEYIDYLIIQMFCANTDWPGNNIKYWRHKPSGGKWRWILYDTDFGFGIWGQQPSQNMFQFTSDENGPGWPNPPWSTFLFRKLLESQTFKEQFIQRYSYHLNTTFQADRVLGVIDSIQGIMEPEFQRHINHWGQPGSMSEWYSRIDEMKNYVQARPQYVWNNMRGFFGLGSQVFLEIEAAPDTLGYVRMRNQEILKEGFSGLFLAGTPIALEALPLPGYQLKEWVVYDLVRSDQTLIQRGSSWRYNDTGTQLPSNWYTAAFDEAAWPTGNGELGYGDGGENTILTYGPDSQNKYITYYFKKRVNLSDTDMYKQLDLELMRDDGAVVYINGVEAYRVNMPAGQVNSTTLAIAFVGDADEYTYFNYTLDPELLQSGENILAVEIHQASVTSSDISFDLSLKGVSYQELNPQVYSGTELNLTLNGHKKVYSAYESIIEVPQLFINEIMASNQTSHPDEYGEYDDWIEIFNAGEGPVNMAGYYITDNLNNPEKWQIQGGFPDQTVIPSGGYLVFFADNDSTSQGPLHLNFKLSKDGEDIGISGIVDNTFYWFDQYSFGPQQTDVAFGRYGDGADNWVFLEDPTPGFSNLLSSFIERQLPGWKISVYPNPTNGIINLEVDWEQMMPSDIIIEMYDAIGHLVYKDLYRQGDQKLVMQMNLSALERGLYFMRITRESESRVVKVIKQ